MGFSEFTTRTFQALKGILTAGASKTIVYSVAKLKKMLKSMKKT